MGVMATLWMCSQMGRQMAGEANGKVSLDEIEGQLRALAGRAGEVVNESKTTAIAAGTVAATLVVAAAYLHGRRRGRKRASVLEIRRI
jgi:hypothetical protein